LRNGLLATLTSTIGAIFNLTQSVIYQIEALLLIGGKPQIEFAIKIVRRHIRDMKGITGKVSCGIPLALIERISFKMFQITRNFCAGLL